MRAHINGRLMRFLAAPLFVVLVVSSMAARQSPAADPFARVAPLIGRWEGTSEGRPGNGKVQREYARALNDRFIRVRNRVVYAPQEKNPKGEVHEDEGFISFDRSRKALVFRQFHVEGFVNQFLESPESTPTRLVFTSEAIDNIPPGWRARETYVIAGADTFEEIFELVEPGKPFEVYSQSKLTRMQ